MSQGTLEGKSIALFGRFYRRKQHLQEELEALGARITRSITPRTDLLFVGSGASGWRLEQARLLSVPTYQGETLRQLLSGAQEVQWLPCEEQPQPERRPDTPETFESLLCEARALAAAPHTGETWLQICALLDAAPASAQQVLLGYLQPHTESWSGDPDCDLRSAPEEWLPPILSGHDDPKHSLVRALDLGDLSLTGQTLSALLEQSHLSQLQSLRLGGNRPSNAFFSRWVERQAFPELRHLCLSRSKLTAKMLRTLGQAQAPLGYLDLPGARLDDKAIDALCNGPLYQEVRHLDLSRNEFSDQFLRVVARGGLEAVEHLALDALGLLDSGVQRLAQCPQWCGLQSLSLRRNFLTSRGLRSLAQEAPFVGLQELYLDHCLWLEEDFLALLYDAPFAQTLRVLEFEGVELGPERFDDWLQAPFAGQLESLSMAPFRPDQSCIHRLLEATHLQLKHLDLDEVFLDDDDLDKLLHHPGFLSLESLSLDPDVRFRHFPHRIREATGLSEGLKAKLLGTFAPALGLREDTTDPYEAGGSS